MKTYLLILMSAAALTAGPAISLADHDDERGGRGGWHQRGGPGGGFGNPERMVERMSRHLDLDETQQQALSNIVTAAKPEFDALRERARANRKAMRELDPADPDYSAKLSNLAAENGELVAEGTRLFGRVRAEVAGELTPEQRAELEAAITERRERFRERRGGRAPE